MSDRLITLSQIIDAVEQASAVTRREMLSERRPAALVEARFTVWWLASKLTLLSEPAIGAAMNRNHSSVRNGIAQAEAQRAGDPDYRAATDALMATLLAVEKNAAIRLAVPIDPLATARRVLWNPTREAVRVSVSEILAMARFVVAHTEPTEPEPFQTVQQEIDNAA